MATLGISLLAVVVAIAAAIGCQPAGCISNRRVQSAWFVLIAVIIAASPLLIPANERLARGFFALFCICLMFKVLDLYRDAQRGERPSLRQWIRFLANPVFLVRRREGLEKQPTTRANLRDLLRHGVILLLSAATFDALMRVNWVGLPFLLEHTMKSLTLFVVGISIFSVCAALFRMAGCYETDPIDRPFASRSIAEFWRRYNRWIGAALHENVFKSAGGTPSDTRDFRRVHGVSADSRISVRPREYGAGGSSSRILPVARLRRSLDAALPSARSRSHRRHDLDLVVPDTVERAVLQRCAECRAPLPARIAAMAEHMGNRFQERLLVALNPKTQDACVR